LNATETIFALALASNFSPEKNFEKAYSYLKTLGQIEFSNIYIIPCRDGVGADYWNSACLLKSNKAVDEILLILKNMEAESGRVRPSHKISLDVDLIAWGTTLNSMEFNVKKLPLALDVKVPMLDIWQHESFHGHQTSFKKMNIIL
jgi:2-amino-4-hydroxy-6-hydroxymethyldihydropteridine diphosphokinase